MARKPDSNGKRLPFLLGDLPFSTNRRLKSIGLDGRDLTGPRKFFEVVGRDNPDAKLPLRDLGNLIKLF